jgi:uracil-DNA glycosylase
MPRQPRTALKPQDKLVATPAAMAALLAEVRACTVCAAQLPLGPRPVLRASPSARLLIVGQAPGTKVHASGIPWDDASGARLRDWLDMTPELFYDSARVAIVPMGLCYPGKGASGDLPPRPECAPLWHARLLAQMPQIALTLLVGQYAQAHYLGKAAQAGVSDTVAAFGSHLPRFLPLPHPSPRNVGWFRRNPWFEQEVVPALRARVRQVLA